MNPIRNDQNSTRNGESANREGMPLQERSERGVRARNATPQPEMSLREEENVTNFRELPLRNVLNI